MKERGQPPDVDTQGAPYGGRAAHNHRGNPNTSCVGAAETGTGVVRRRRATTLTKIERVNTIGRPNFDAWGSALPFASVAGAIWEAAARCQQQQNPSEQ